MCGLNGRNGARNGYRHLGSVEKLGTAHIIAVCAPQGLREEAAKYTAENDEEDVEELYRSMAKRGRHSNGLK